MKQHIYLIMGFLLIAALGACMPSTDTGGGGGDDEASSIAGVVSRELDVIEHGHDQGSLLQLFGSADLQSGDRLSVHDGGAGRLNFGDDMLVRVFNDTVLKEIRAEIDPEAPLDVQMFLAEGGLTGRLSDARGQVTVTTPNDAKITILGTDFFILYDPQKDEAVAGNFEGTVEVTVGGRTERLRDGYYVVIANEEPPEIQLPIYPSISEFERRAIELESPLGAFEELACQDDLEILAGGALPPGTVLPPDAPIRYTWEVRNNGSCPWDGEYTLQFVSGEAMTAQTAVTMAPTVDPGEQTTLSVVLRTPGRAGDYSAVWRLFDPTGEPVGPPLEVVISVSDGDEDEEPPTEVPPTKVPPTDRPATEVPPTEVPPTDKPATEVPPTEKPPTEVPPTVDPCRQPQTVTADVDAFVRTGPGPEYDEVTALLGGQQAEVTGRSQYQPLWWRIALPGYATADLWVWDDIVTFEGTEDCVEPVEAKEPPAPTPEPVIVFPPPELVVDKRCSSCETLFWESENVEAVSVNGKGVALSGSLDACLSSSEEYKLDSGADNVVQAYEFLAEAPNWTAEQLTELIWIDPPFYLTRLFDSPTARCSELKWEALEAAWVSLEGEPVEPAGTRTICPTESHTYVLEADIGCTILRDEVTVDVGEIEDCLPDLVVSSVSIPTTWIVYQATPWTWIDYTVSNIGCAATPEGTIYLRNYRNGSIDSGYMTVEGPIAPGGSTSKSFAVGHDNAWPPGTYTVELEVDYRQEIEESSETNNISDSVTFQVVADFED